MCSVLPLTTAEGKKILCYLAGEMSLYFLKKLLIHIILKVIIEITVSKLVKIWYVSPFVSVHSISRVKLVSKFL